MQYRGCQGEARPCKKAFNTHLHFALCYVVFVVSVLLSAVSSPSVYTDGTLFMSLDNKAIATLIAGISVVHF